MLYCIYLYRVLFYIYLYIYRRMSSRKSFGTAVPSNGSVNAANTAAVSAAHLSSMYQTVLKMSSENVSISFERYISYFYGILP